MSDDTSSAHEELSNALWPLCEPMSVDEMHRIRQQIGELLGVEMTALAFAPFLGRTNVWISDRGNPKKNPSLEMPEPYPLLIRLLLSYLIDTVESRRSGEVLADVAQKLAELDES